MGTPERGCQCSITAGGTNVGYATGGTLSCEKGEIDITTLDSNRWKEILGGIKSATLDLPCLYVGDDTGQTALYNAWNDDTTVEVEVFTTSGFGFSFTARVMSVGMEIELEGAVGFPVNLASTGTITRSSSLS